ncbi:MAG: WecB/TagA/CpsF family glycosyltransferase [Candidatus Acetothermia bacterium]|jgi:N-acetylglucosaminyldiphosphoundecaprenol N-acetyl-beta-D-mannosaminyltransferase|nr:WecB/TagA/CpsF family glycosyltransferase [Candidatus Acetothermia bacterium]MDH7505287.1 WecB/TagA/CpsF family glycosyltransferase [Candidatus Acetothermia bacterium]
MELVVVLGLALIAGLAFARRRPGRSLLALPLALIPLGPDGRLLGLGAGLAMLLVGSALGRRWGNSPWLRLALVLFAGGIAYAAGFRISFITSPSGGFIYLSYLSLPLTLGWIAVVAHSLSLINSWSAGRLGLKIALLTTVVFLIIGLFQGQSPLFALALVVSLLGLLSAWFLRGRGLAAPEAVGFALALISIAGVLKTTASLALLGPLLSLGLPLWTTTLPIAYGPAERAALLRTLRHHGLLFYLLASYFSIGLVLWRTPRPGLLLLGGLVPLGFILWRWGSPAAGDQLLSTERQLRLFGVPLARLRLQEAADFLERRLAEGRQAVVMTPDTTALWRAQRDQRLKEAYQQADLVTADGTGIVWASRFWRAPLPERVTGIELAEELCRRAASRGYRLFLLGAAPGVAEEAKAQLEERFPGIRIVGTHHGYFADDREIIGLINASEAEVLLVGLGVPRQELWMLEHKRELKAKVLIGVGGSLDVLSGRLPRAPRVLRQLGLEWLYRLLRQPWRARRALAIPPFILRVLLLEPGREVL